MLSDDSMNGSSEIPPCAPATGTGRHPRTTAMGILIQIGPQNEGAANAAIIGT